MPSTMLLIAGVLTAARCSPVSHGKIMRNNMLLSKMMSDFHKENLPLIFQDEDSETARVIETMQNVLCHNFPSIPCSIIKKDKELSKLIYKSVGQLTHKEMRFVTHTPRGTVMPFLNSEEITFYTDSNGNLNQERKQKRKKAASVRSKQKSYWSFDLPKNKTFLNPATAGRKRVRTFYPHKTKYKDKRTFRETAEKYSLANEMPVFVPPEAHHNHRHLMVTETPDVQWRIDYARHSSANYNRYGIMDQFKQKLVKSANFGGDANLLEEVHSRENTEQKHLKHPDVYIKKNMGKHYLRVQD